MDTQVENLYPRMEGTTPIYYYQPYLTELHCEVVRIEDKGAQCLVELDKTIFFPEGGGQPCDQGEIIGSAGKLRVDQVRTVANGRIIHQGKLNGLFASGDQVRTVLKWGPRYKNMRVHSAGHLIHDVLMSMVGGLTPTKGNHGQKAFLEYQGQLDPGIKEQLEAKANQVVAEDCPIITHDTTYEEITSKCRFVPPGLPRDKQLRVIRIGSFDPMPDGGVQVQSTREIGNVVIHSITAADNNVVIRYGVTN